MTNRTHTGLLVLVLAAGLAGCQRASPSPTAPSTRPQQTPSPGNPSPAFSVSDVTVSGVVFERTPTGRVPIEGVTVANGEGWSGLTDANGSFSFTPVWVCPCAAEPGVDAGTTSLWVGKDGYADPAGQPPSRFSSYAGAGYRDVKIDGDTRFDIELVPNPFTQQVSNTVPASKSGVLGVYQFDMTVPRTGTAAVTLRWPDGDFSLQLYVTTGTCAGTTSLVTGGCSILGTTRPGTLPGVVTSSVTKGDLNTIWVLNTDHAPQSFTLDIEIK